MDSELKKIKLNPLKFYAKANQNFNSETESIIDDFFQTNSIENDDYIRVGDYFLEQINEFTPFNEIEKAVRTYNKKIKYKFIDSATNKDYENLLANLMQNGNFKTYVIAGGMGTGKSSVCNYIVDLLIKKLDDKGNFIINIKFDFNGNYTGTDDEILNLFKRELFDKLWIEIDKYITVNPNSLNKFTDILADNSKKDEYYEFSDFDCYEQLDWVENTLSLKEKLKKLKNYIKSYEDKLNPVLKLVHFIAHTFTSNSVIFVFDNIDILSTDSQRSILMNIFKYNTVSRIKCFVPLRRATFKRTLKAIQKDSSTKSVYSFGYIHHHGVEPLKVVLNRVNKVIKEFENNKLISELDYEYKTAILDRLKLYKFLLETENPFSKFFGFICGRSSRLGLILSNRFFINNVVSYKDNNVQYDLAIKSFMVSDNESFVFDNRIEKRIANILCHNSISVFSFLQYLILQTISNTKEIEFLEIKRIFRNVKDCSIMQIEQSDFLDALNSILSVSRPLIWSDDKSYYDNDINLEECDNTLQLTELGKGYLEMIKYNTQYLQECIMSLRWKLDYIPQQYESFNFTDRFSFLRKCIMEIFIQEKNEINYNGITPLSKVIFTTIGNSYYNIINNSDSLIQSQNDEIYSWKSLRNIIYNQYSDSSHDRFTYFLDNYV
jgi:hypothetical protein